VKFQFTNHNSNKTTAIAEDILNNTHLGLLYSQLTVRYSFRNRMDPK